MITKILGILFLAPLIICCAWAAVEQIQEDGWGYVIFCLFIVAIAIAISSTYGIYLLSR